MKILLSVLKEDGQYSFTRLVSLTLIVVFLIASFYLILHGSTWGNYDSFATFCGGGGAATQIINKFINSKYNTVYNTVQGSTGKPNNIEK